MRTGIIRATLNDLAKVLGLSGEEQASDALKSEKAFKLSRRGLFVSAGALVVGKTFSVPAPADWYLGIDPGIASAARYVVMFSASFDEKNGVWTAGTQWMECGVDDMEKVRSALEATKSDGALVFTKEPQAIVVTECVLEV